MLSTRSVDRLRVKRLHRHNPTLPEINNPATVTPTEILTNAAVDNPGSFSDLVIEWRVVSVELVEVSDAWDAVETGVEFDTDVPLSFEEFVPQILKDPEFASGISLSEEYSAKWKTVASVSWEKPLELAFQMCEVSVVFSAFY